MKIDITKLSDELAADPEVTDYDFWRALKSLDHQFHLIERSGAPIPMTIIQQRSILTKARAKRRTGLR